MRFLADESCDFGVVRALRAAGHEVTAIVELSPRADDDLVLDRALHDERVLITEDKDFGQLVYADKQASNGVIFIRYPTKLRRRLPQTVVQLVKSRGETLLGCFVVVQPGRIRIGKKPSERESQNH